MKSPTAPRKQISWMVRAVLLIVALAGVFAVRSRGLLNTEPTPTPGPALTPPLPDSSPPTGGVSLRTKIPDVTIRDLDGKVVYQGEVDVSRTLERIERGERLAFRNDGAAFGNREGRLPRKPDNYYREWVHLTPTLSGPGPQRIVVGEGGEIFYTADHYKSFRQLK